MMSAGVSGFYIPGEGWLYRPDPRVKLWVTLLAVLLAIFVGRLAVLAGLLVASQAALLLGGVPPRQLGRVWRSLAPLVVVILVLQPLLAPGEGAPLAQVGPLRLTEAGLLLGLRYGLRVSAAAFAVLVPVLTTPTNALVRALQKLGMPLTWAMTVGLALRYLGTIGELYATIAEAQQARGWDPSTGGLIRRARGAIPTLIALIVASLRLSDSLALGLAARGFGAGQGGAPRVTLHDIAMRPIDWAVLAAITLAFGAMFALALLAA